MPSLMLVLPLVASAAHAGAPVEIGLADLLSGQPPALSGGILSLCEGPRTALEDVSAALAEAERALAYQDLAAVAPALERAESLVLCLEGPVAAHVASRGPFLAGVAAAQRGDDAGAVAAFTLARAIYPSIPWDETYPPEVRARFESAPAPAASAELRLVPHPRAGALWVDGRLQEPSATGAEPLRLAPGPHLVQLPDAGWLTARVRLEADSRATLVVPALAPDDPAPWLEDPGRRAELDTLLATALPTGTAVRVVGSEATWQGEVGSTEWTALPSPSVPERARATPLARGLVLAGGGLTVGGAALLGYGLLSRAHADQAAEAAETWTEYEQQQGRHDLATQQVGLGWKLAAGGLAGASAGLVLTVRGRSG